MYKTLVKTVGLPHEKWLEYRRMGIGGSDAGAVLGFNPYKGPYMVYIEKVEEYQPDLDGKEAVYWGNVLEDVVAEEFSRRSGKKVRRVNAVLQSSEHPFMLANLDREIVGENAILECKTTNAFLAGEWDGEEVPASYICQCQHYLAVTGAEVCYIACLIGGNRFVWKEIVRDEEFIAYLIDAERQFWEGHVLAKQPPAADGRGNTTAFLDGRYADSTGEEIVLPKGAVQAAEEYRRLTSMRKELDEKLEACKNQLKSSMGHAEAGVCGKFVVTWKPQSQTRVDTQKLKEAYPEIYKDVTKTVSFRKFECRER